MVRNVVFKIWLCWIFLYLLVQCQFNVDGFGNSPFPGGFSSGPIGNRLSNGDFRGGRLFDGFPSGFGPGDLPFRGNGLRRPQQEQQEGPARMPPEESETDVPSVPETPPAAAPEAPAPVPAPVEEPAPTATPTTEPVSVPLPPAPVATTPVAEELASDEPYEPEPATPSRLTPLVEQATSTTVSPEETTTSVAASPILVPAIETTTSNSLTDSSRTIQPSRAAATSTTTTSMAIVVTPTPTDSRLPASDPSTTSTILDLSPLAASRGSGMSTSTRVGLGVGISFGLICLASIAGLYLWHRRQNQRYARNARGGNGGLGGFFLLNRQRTSKSDAEWEIANAEKVEIVSGASARTLSRSDSRSTRPSRDADSRDINGGGSGAKPALQIVKVGMRVPDRPHPALTSNPPMPSPSQFPTPPSSRGFLGNGKKTGSGGSWPLPE